MENKQPANKGDKTFLALPIYGIDPFFAISVWNLVASKVMEGGIRPQVGDSSPSRVRNTLVHAFLESDCDQLLFIDSDLSFTPQDIQRLIGHKELVVGGFYCAKQQGNAKLIFNALESNPPCRADGMQKVKFMGTGLLKVRRPVFEMMLNKFGEEMKFQLDEAPAGTFSHAFFEERVWRYPNGATRFLTEDWLFCQRCIDLGLDVWADTGILVQHHGPVSYPLETQKPQILRAAPVTVASAVSPLPVVPADAARSADSVTQDITAQFTRKAEPVEASK